MMWFDEDEKEYHSGLYFRKYKGDNIASPGLELLFDTVQEAAEYVKGNCSTTEEEDISYHIEDTYLFPFSDRGCRGLPCPYLILALPKLV